MGGRPDQSGAAGQGDRGAKVVTRRAAPRGQRAALPAPGAVGAHENVGDALEGLVAHLAVRRADERGVAGESDRGAEVVLGDAAAYGQRAALLAPGAVGAHEDIGGALRGVGADLVAGRPNQGGVALDGDRGAKGVTGRAVGGGQRAALLAPGAAGAHEDVHGALRGVVADLVAGRPDQGGVARESDRVAEEVNGAAVGRGERRLPQGEYRQGIRERSARLYPGGVRPGEALERRRRGARGRGIREQGERAHKDGEQRLLHGTLPRLGVCLAASVAGPDLPAGGGSLSI